MAKNEATLLLRIKQAGSEVLDRLVITLGDVMNIMESVGEAVWTTIEAYREEQLAVNQLTQSMINQGVFTGELRSEYINMASALQEMTTFGDEQIINAQAIIQAQMGQKKITNELMTAVLDLAAAKKMDLASAADLVGKAIAGNTGVLSRHGVKVKESADDHQRLANIIGALDQKFHGQAAAMAKDLGKIDQLKNAWSDFLERIGHLMTPMITAMAAGAGAVLKFMNAFMPQKLDLAKASVVDIQGEIQKLRIKIINLQDTLAKTSVHDSGIATGIKNQISALEKEILSLKEARDKLTADEKLSSDNRVINARNEAIEKARIRQEAEAEKVARQQEQALLEQDLLNQTGLAKLQIEMRLMDAKIKAEEDHRKKLELLKQRADLVEKIGEQKKLDFEKKNNDERIANQRSTFNTIATLQSSSNKALATIGKAAAITQIAIDTPVAIGRAMAAFPPPFNFAAAGLVGAAMAAQAARVAGVQLAEGGIVQARPGGTQATIGEGGRDEAVIPLDDPRTMERLGGMGGVTVVFQGPILADNDQADRFAAAIDQALMRRRQRGESVAFDDIF